MDKRLQSSVRVPVSFALAGLVGIVLAAIWDEYRAVFGISGALSIVAGYFVLLSNLYKSRKSIPVLDGSWVTIERNPVLYRFQFLFFSLLGIALLGLATHFYLN